MRREIEGPKVGRVLFKVLIVCFVGGLAALGAKSVYSDLIFSMMQKARVEGYNAAASNCSRFVWDEAKKNGRISLTNGEDGQKIVLVPESKPETQKGEVQNETE